MSRWVAALTAVSLLSVAACSDDSPPEASPSTTAPPEVIETDEGAVSITERDGRTFLDFLDEDGTATGIEVGPDGDVVIAGSEDLALTPGLPAGWPEGFPEPEGGTLQGGSLLGGAGITQRAATWIVPGDTTSAAEVVDRYRDALGEADPIVTVASAEPARYRATISLAGGWNGFVAISAIPTDAPDHPGDIEVAVHLLQSDEAPADG